MLEHPRDRELVDHYVRFQGPYQRIFRFDEVPETTPNPIFVLEFAPAVEEYDWIYITAGMSRKPMPLGLPDHHIELMMYAGQRQEELANVLAKLARYPFVNATRFVVGDTIAGMPGEGIVAGSPLTEFILTHVYFESEGFDTILHSDGSHTHVMWATPIYLSERMFVKQHGWRALVEEVFPEQEVQPADLWRPPAI